MRKVGFIGLGNMGKGMCKNLIAKGNDVSVYDLNPQAMDAFSGKARLCTSAVEVLENSEVVFLSLPNSDIIEATVEQFLEWFPGVNREQVLAVLKFAESSLTETAV